MSLLALAFPIARTLKLPVSRDQAMLLMLAVNELFLGVDTYLAHSLSGTLRPYEWIPIYFGPIAGALLALAGLLALRQRAFASLLATLVFVASAAVGVLDRYKVKRVLDNGADAPHRHNDGTEDPGATQQMAVHAWLKGHPGGAEYLAVRAADIPEGGLGGPTVDAIAGCERAATDPRFTVLWGEVTHDLETYGDNPNNHSVVVRVDYGESAALFTGDLELIGLSRLAERYEKRPELLDVDIYQVGHHGSKNATIHYQMALMSPRVAVISMGPYERNIPWTARKYGHPHILAMEHLVHPQYGVRGRRAPKEVWVGFRGAFQDKVTEIFERRTIDRAVYGTGWDGTVVIAANANGWLDIETKGR